MPVWVDKKNDTVLVNTRYTDAIGHLEVAPHLPEHRRCDLKADGLFGMITRNTVHVAVFAGGIIGNTLRPGLCQALTNADRVSVVVGVFRFDGMTDGEAAVTELFGLFGEESMALVPANNTGSPRKLFTAHAAFRPQTAAEFVNSHYARYARAFFENWAGGDACVRHMTWFPQRGMRRRPSDFDAYCEEMRGFSISTMAACAFSVRIRDRKQSNSELAAVLQQMSCGQTDYEVPDPAISASTPASAASMGAPPSTPTILLILATWLQLVELYDKLFGHVRDALQEMPADAISAFRGPMGMLGPRVPGMGLMQGDLSVKIMIQVIQHQLEGVELLLGLPDEYCVARRGGAAVGKTHVNTLFARHDVEAHGLLQPVMMGLPNGAGKATVASLREKIKEVQGILGM